MSISGNNFMEWMGRYKKNKILVHSLVLQIDTMKRELHRQTKTFEGPDDGDQRGMGRGGRHVVRVLAF